MTTTTTAVSEPVPAPAGKPVSYRQRLVEGMAASIRERGYRETTVADVVRHARTSRRTFYAEFASKDECYAALMSTTNERMRRHIESSVRASSPWRAQVRQAVEAYIDALAAEPEIMLSCVRELPAIGPLARTVQREAIDTMTAMLLELTDTEPFRAAGAGPLSRPLSLLLLGGIRELTATIVEDGGDIRSMAEVATAAATALLSAHQAKQRGTAATP